MASSANQSFLIIAGKRQLLPKARLERYLREADEQGLDLAEYLVAEGALEPDEVVAVVRARARHGRTCTACQQLTYMLPGNAPGKTPCEHCGGTLEAGPPQPKTGRPVVAAAGAPPPPIPGMSAAIREQGLDDRTPSPDERTPVPDDRTPNPDGPSPYPVASSPYPVAAASPAYPGQAGGGYDDPYGAPADPGGFNEGAPRPTHSIWQEVPSLILYPVKTPQAIAMVTLGALFAALVQGLSGNGFAMTVGCCGFVGMGVYIWMFLINVTREGMGGGSEVPPFPDFEFEAILGTLVRVLSFHLACYLPVVILFGIAVSFAPNAFAFWASRQYATIGAHAHLASGEKQALKGQSIDGARFLRPDGFAIDTAGKWIVIGLLGADTGDDTDMDITLGDMQTGTINHAAQIYDLDRVGRALAGKVRVIAAYADPRKRLLTIRWPFTLPEDEREELLERFGTTGWQGQFDPHSGADVERAIELGAGAGTVGVTKNPFSTIQFATTDDFMFPAPFAELRRFPAVYVVNPSGEIVREYTTGVYDQKLYADVQSLMKGGDGDAFAQSLPSHVYVNPGEAPQGSSASVIFMLGLIGLAVVFGLVYFPMAYLLMVVYDSPTSPWAYPLAFRSMFSVGTDYLGLLVIGIGIFALSIVLNVVLSVVFVAAPALLQLVLVSLPCAWLAFYSQVAVCYAAGRFYYLNQDRLEWL